MSKWDTGLVYGAKCVNEMENPKPRMFNIFDQITNIIWSIVVAVAVAVERIIVNC